MNQGELDALTVKLKHLPSLVGIPREQNTGASGQERLTDWMIRIDMRIQQKNLHQFPDRIRWSIS
jgi:hypothetical protein